MENGTTIAIIDSNLENRADLQKMLDGSEFSVVADVGYGVHAAMAIEEAAANCILLSLEEPVVRGLQTMKAIAEVAPSAPIIVYSSLDDRLVVRQAMQAGARDYLRTPLTGEVLVASVRDALEHEQALQHRLAGGASEPGRGTVVTVFGSKGGVGKSAIATNLALAIARETSASVALVDMDIRFGCAAILLDVSADKTLVQACHEVQSITHTNVREYLCNDVGGIWVLAASRDPVEPETIDSSQIRNLISILSQSFDYVVLDTPGALNEAVAVSLEQATVVLLISSAEVPSVTNTLVALKVLSGWSYPAERIKLVLNHPNAATGVTQRSVADALGHGVFWEIPFDSAVSRSVQQGRPLVLTNPRSEAAKSIVALARKIGGISPPVQYHRLDPLRSVGSFLRRVALPRHQSEAAGRSHGVERELSPTGA